MAISRVECKLDKRGNINLKINLDLSKINHSYSRLNLELIMIDLNLFMLWK